MTKPVTLYIWSLAFLLIQNVYRIHGLECYVCSEGLDSGCENNWKEQPKFSCDGYKTNTEILKRIQHNKQEFDKASANNFTEFDLRNFHFEWQDTFDNGAYECFKKETWVRGTRLFWRGCRDDAFRWPQDRQEFGNTQGFPTVYSQKTGIVEKLYPCGQDLCNTAGIILWSPFVSLAVPVMSLLVLSRNFF